MADSPLAGDITADWAGPGRGLHVDFGADEVIPLEEDHFLGHGGAAVVHETTVQNQKLALKKVWSKWKLGGTVTKEIEILKKLRHHHFVRLVASYTHKKCLYLSDFDIATDFSLMSRSATDRGGGTFQYLSPETAAMNPSGRASDMFSLGCVLLEILVFDQDATLQRLRSNLPMPNTAYHSILERIDSWLPWNEDFSPMKHLLCLEIRAMLSRDQDKRPCADQLVSRISLCDNIMEDSGKTVFADCCRVSYSTERQFESRSKALQVQIDNAEQERHRLQRKHHDALEEAARVTSQALAEQAEQLQHEHRDALERAWWTAEHAFAEQAERLQHEHHDALEKAWWAANQALAEKPDHTRSEDCKLRTKHQMRLLRFDTESQHFKISRSNWWPGSRHQTKSSEVKVPTNMETEANANVFYYCPRRIEKLVGITITAIIFILLIIPVLAICMLTSIVNQSSKLALVAVIVLFTSLFSAAMSLLTKAQRHELFAASAAYCAVLIVLMSNLSNDSNDDI